MKTDKSLKINFIMNTILTCSAYIFPLITFPYISRVLGVDGNGKINFANSIINYFVMFASLGIPIYGIRACANVRNNKKELSKTVHELLILNIIMCCITYIILFNCIFLIDKIYQYKNLIFIFSSTLLLNCIGVEWLYKALEEYSYITIRSIIFKIIAIILMFLFVKTKNDYVTYAIIMVIGSSASFIFNIVKLPKYIYIKKYESYNLLKHLKPIFMFFLLSVSWTIYTNLDVIMLGFMKGNVEVGYYSAAIKIKSILVSTVSALGAVLLPRLTVYINDKNEEKFYKLLKKNCNFIIITSFSIIAFLVINAYEIMIFLSGSEYIPAVPVMQVVVFSILFIGLSTMTGTNLLVPIGKESITVLATVGGIVINIILNYMLIPKFGAVGAALSTVIGEVTILLIECLYLRNKLSLVFDKMEIIKILIATIITSIFIMFVKGYFIKSSTLIVLLITTIIYWLVYIIILILFKEQFILDEGRNILKIFKRLL